MKNVYLDRILPQPLREKFVDDVLTHLKESYIVLETGEKCEGEAISVLRANMSGKGYRSVGRTHDRWANLPPLGDFENLLEYVGFSVLRCKNLRGNKARVVTL